jgi:hypothetical protein
MGQTASVVTAAVDNIQHNVRQTYYEWYYTDWSGWFNSNWKYYTTPKEEPWVLLKSSTNNYNDEDYEDYDAKTPQFFIRYDDRRTPNGLHLLKEDGSPTSYTNNHHGIIFY